MKRFKTCFISLFISSVFACCLCGEAAAVTVGGGNDNGNKTNIAIGTGEEGDERATASGGQSIAIGHNVTASGQYAITLGQFSEANAKWSTAIGYDSHATAQDAISFGNESEASGRYSMALGSEAKASGQDSVVIGHGASNLDDNGDGHNYAVAIGGSAKAATQSSTAIGGNAKAYGSQSTAIGASAEVAEEADAGTALGNAAKVTSKYGVALGINSTSDRLTSPDGIFIPTGADGGAIENTVIHDGYDYYGVVSIGREGDDYSFTRQLTGVAAGAADTDAVNVAQLKGLGEAVANVIGGGVSFNGGTWDGFTIGGGHYGSLVEAISSLSSGGDWTFNATDDEKGNVGSSVIESGGKLTLNGGKNVEISKDGDYKYTVSVSDNPNFSKVTAESVSVGGKVNISSGGIDMGGTRLTGLADGSVSAGSSDAVTGGQLWDTYQRMGTMENNIYREMDDLREDVNVVGAHAAALSGLHPIQYNPYEPTTLSAAVGTYRDEYAVAVGVFHYTRENVMFNLGASLCSDGDLMGRAGVSFALGKSSDKKPRLASTMGGLQKQVLDMQTKLDSLEEKNARNEEIIKQNAEIMAQNEKLIRELTKRLEAER